MLYRTHLVTAVRQTHDLQGSGRMPCGCHQSIWSGTGRCIISGVLVSIDGGMDWARKAYLHNACRGSTFQKEADKHNGNGGGIIANLVAYSHMLLEQHNHCNTEKPAHQPRLLARLLQRILQHTTVTTRSKSLVAHTTVQYIAYASTDYWSISTVSPRPSHLYTVNRWT